MVVDLVDANLAALLLILNLSLLRECLDQILDMPLLINQDVECLLWTALASDSLRGNTADSIALTSFVIPSETHVILTFFLVSSSARLISRTSK